MRSRSNNHERGDEAMKYFMDTHDRSKGSWPKDDISEAEFVAHLRRVRPGRGRARRSRPRGARERRGVPRVLLHVRPGRGRDPAGAREAALSVRLDHRGPAGHRRRSTAADGTRELSNRRVARLAESPSRGAGPTLTAPTIRSYACRVASPLQPSHSGCCAVPSKRAVVLNSSYCAVGGGLAVRAQQRGDLRRLERLEASAPPRAPDRDLRMRSMPVITTEVGRRIA